MVACLKKSLLFYFRSILETDSSVNSLGLGVCL